MKKKGLGKGLDALFEENAFDISEKPINELALVDIEPDRNQPRRDFDDAALQALSKSIERHGVISPLIVTPIGEGRYRIIAGERRWRAAKLAGLERVPVIVRECESERISEISLVENLQREDLNPLEEAFGYKRLCEVYGLSQEQAAQAVSKSRSAVANAMRLLSLPEQAQDYLRTGELTAGHARALLSLEKEDDIMLAANKIIADELSVRAAEQLVKKMKEQPKAPNRQSPEVMLALSALESRAQSGTGSKVRIKHSASNRGRIEIFYNSTAELEKLIDKLS